MSGFTAEQEEFLATNYVARDSDATTAADVHWLLYCGVLVFGMQSGFAMLCAGRGAGVTRSSRASGGRPRFLVGPSGRRTRRTFS